MRDVGVGTAAMYSAIQSYAGIDQQRFGRQVAIAQIGHAVAAHCVHLVALWEVV